MNLGLYIHIPFCLRKCLYCDFPSYTGLEHLYVAYTDALVRDIATRSKELSKYSIDTIYLGGGTPTVLSERLLNAIFDAVYRFFNISLHAEISVEANPGTLSKEYLEVLNKCGVNRLSLGVQSFNDKLLNNIGRIHTAANASYAVKETINAGITNVNVDLMYGLPGQTVLEFSHSLQVAIELSVSHISVYGLKIEARTPFAKLEDDCQLDLPDEDGEANMYELACSFLPQKGFARYEISNYALPNMQCRHNLKYWQYEQYIGIGAYAHSFFAGERRTNICDVSKYIEYTKYDYCMNEIIDKVDKATSMAEFIFLALRTKEGLNFAKFVNTFHENFLQLYNYQVEMLERKELIHISAENVYLTTKGMKYGNYAFRSFLPD